MEESRKKSKTIGTILGIFGFIALVAGATYAWLTWRSNNIIVAGSTECFDVVYYRKDLGTEENPAMLRFFTSYNRDNLNQLVANPDYAEVGLSLDPKCTNVAGLGKLYLTTNVDTSDAILTGGLYYTLVQVENDTETFIQEGPITSKGDMLLKDNIFVSSTTSGVKYRVYIWINGPITTDQNYVGASYVGEIRAEVVSQEDNTPPVYLAQHITDLYTNATKTEVTNNSITYNYATSVKLMNDRLGGTTSSLDGGNIRYYGVNPNNYIDIGDRDTMPWKKIPMFADMFETSEQCYQTADCTTNYANIGQLVGQNFTSAAQCEAAMPSLLASAGVSSVDEICGEIPILWRIIGVFDGKLRIRRNDSIGAYSFDTSDSSVNGGWGINQWGPSGSYEGADLMRLFNPGYEGESVNNSLYWTSGSGTCYNGQSNATTSCNFTNTGLSTTAKKYVVDQTLYLGGFDSNEIYANVAYSTERGTNVIQNPADNVTRTLSWTGKVGLIYPSDYGYAADFTNNNCKSNLYDNSHNCTETWMNGLSWMISPWAAYPYYEMRVSNDTFNGNYADYDYGGWPVLTLSSDALLETGDGSKSTPYVLAA